MLRCKDGLCVLVVDDNRDAAETMAMLLRMAGHVVHIAYDGPAALEAVRSLRPRVVLLDLGLPGLDGFQVAERIRSIPEGARILLIAISGYGQDEHRRTHEAGRFRSALRQADRSECGYGAAGGRASIRFPRAAGKRGSLSKGPLTRGAFNTPNTPPRELDLRQRWQPAPRVRHGVFQQVSKPCVQCPHGPHKRARSWSLTTTAMPPIRSQFCWRQPGCR